MSLREDIATKLAEIAPSVENAVVEAMVAREVQKRSNALVQVLDKLTKAEYDFRRLKPDVTHFDMTGTLVSAAYTKEALDARNKAQEKIEKMEKAINRALDHGDYADVYKLSTSEN